MAHMGAILVCAGVPSGEDSAERGGRMLIEGTIVEKEAGLHASFEGVERPYVRLVIARLDNPVVHAEARVVGHEDIPQQIGQVVRLRVTRTVTDRKAGVVRFDCELLA